MRQVSDHSSGSQSLLYLVNQTLGISRRRVVLDTTLLLVNKELSEVPWDDLRASSLWIVKLRFASQVVKHGVSIRTIHLNFFVDWEGTSVLLADERVDLLSSSGFLSSKLVARIGKDLKSAVLQFFMHLN